MEAETQVKKRVYNFQEGDGRNKKLLGGKGANLCEMTQIGLNVPPGFVITTEACLEYLASPERELPKGFPPVREPEKARRYVQGPEARGNEVGQRRDVGPRQTLEQPQQQKRNEREGDGRPPVS